MDCFRSLLRYPTFGEMEGSLFCPQLSASVATVYGMFKVFYRDKFYKCVSFEAYEWTEYCRAKGKRHVYLQSLPDFF